MSYSFISVAGFSALSGSYFACHQWRVEAKRAKKSKKGKKPTIFAFFALLAST
jgi:hypothetical protein